MLDNLMRDLAAAARALRSRPGSTIVVVLSLAIGIGVTTVAFSLFNAMALRGLPDVAGQRRLVALGLSVPDEQGRSLPPSRLALPDIEFLESQHALFSGVAGAGLSDVAADVGDGAFVSRGEVVTSNYFDVLSAHPLLGRTLHDEPNDGGQSREVVASYSFWKHRLGGAPGAIGRTIRVNGQPFLVVGVMPRGFTGMTAGDVVDPDLRGPELWIPMSAARSAGLGPTASWRAEDPTVRWLRAVGRLAPGVSRRGADEAMQVLSRRLGGADPEARGGARLVSGDLIFGPGAGKHRALLTLAVFLVVPVLVLLVACANAASLLLARTAARQRELAIRASLGATRGTLLRQLLSESALLGLLAGILGLLVAVWSRSLAGLFAVHLSMAAPIDFRVFGFALTLSLLVGLGFGLLPALSASSRAPGAGLSDSGRGTGDSRRLARIRHALVVGQVTLALVLLVTCSLFVGSVRRGLTVDTGLQESHLVAFTLDLSLLDYSEARGKAFYRDLAARVRALPGVSGAALSAQPPLSGLGHAPVIAESGASSRGVSASVAYVGLRWFRTAGVPLLAGAAFTTADGDESGAERVAVVSRTMADRLWPGRSPLGAHLLMGEGASRRSLQVVGVVGDVRTELLQPPSPILYLPIQTAYAPRASLLVRSDRPTARVISSVKSAVRSLDADLPIHSIVTVSQARRAALAPWRLVADGMGLLGLLALALAAAGLYAVIAFAVTQRTHEIGVRMALGAAPGRVVRMVFGWTLSLVGGGVILGTLIAVTVASLIRKMLFGVSPFDPITYVGVSLLLLLVGATACAWPAARAASVQPSRTLER